MNALSACALACAIGFVAGLRSMTPLAVVSGAAHFGWLDLRHTWASFFGSPVALCVFSVLALAELVGDKLPKTPSRKSPGPFAGRIIVGALTGAALATAARQSPIAGALLGAVGAVAGTLGGYEARTRLIKALRVPDFAIALLEDAVAIGGGLLIVSMLRS
jgi:uncharacterized membrane protein